MRKTRLSVVIPAYNEAENLPLLIPKIESTLDPSHDDYEIIIVNDGSTDNSGEALKEIQEQRPSVRVIELVYNSGQTAAFDAGFKAARGDIVVTMDADLQNDPADIPKLLAEIEKFDMVCGIRHERKDPFIRRISGRIGNYVRNKMTGDDIVDVGCSLRAIRRKCLDGLQLYNNMHRFLPTLIKLRGCTVTQIKVNHFPRIHGKSKYNVRNRLFSGVADLFAVRWMQKRFLRYEIKETS